MKKLIGILMLATLAYSCTKEQKSCGKVVRSYWCSPCDNQPKYITVIDFGDRVDSFYYSSQRETGAVECPGNFANMRPIR